MQYLQPSTEIMPLLPGYSQRYVR